MIESGVDAYVLSGAGNDFLAVVEPSETPTGETIAAWCRRGLSVGADGFFILDPAAEGARMRYWNGDGGVADLCLNGSRCAAQLAFHLGWGHEGRLTLETAAGRLLARQRGDFDVSLTLPEIIGPVSRHVLALEDRGRQRSFESWLVSVGVPHLVVPWPKPLGSAPVDRLGPLLRSHEGLGPAGANVNFVRFAENAFDVRSFERGVEAETLACGTGVVASAVVGASLGKLSIPAFAQTAGGFVLSVEGQNVSGRLTAAALSGDARVLGRIGLLPGASRLPVAVRFCR